MTKQYTFISLIFILTSTFASAQSLLDYKDQGEDLSPSETRYQQFYFNSQNRMLHTLFSHPTVEHLIATDTTYSNTYMHRNHVSVNYAGASLPNDFHIFEGNNFNNYSVNASGVIHKEKIGTLYGSAEYARGLDKSIGWSSIRHFDTYAPYLSSDSIGGNVNWEMYAIKGGYGFSLNDRWSLGAQFSFKGEQAYRLTDPRLINTTSWLNFDVSASYSSSHKQQLLFTLGYERNKQYLTERYWMPGLQDRFFHAYGFGMYNDMYSRVSFGYSRMHYIQGFNARIAYIQPLENNSHIITSIETSYKDLKTEETSILNLYRSKTIQLNPSLEYQLKRGAFSLTVNAEAEFRIRTGYENIYDQIIIDKPNNIYDYRLISTRQNYNALNKGGLIQIKPSYNFSQNHTLSAIVGSHYFMREEEYKSKLHHVANQWIEPHAGVGYEYYNNKSTLDISIIYSQKTPIDNIYKVSLATTDEIEYLDFQHAFNPYAFYANEYDALRLNLCYIHNFNQFAVGLRAQAMLCKGQRLEDAVYNNKIGFESSAPTISPTPDNYIERWGKVTLFVSF